MQDKTKFKFEIGQEVHVMDGWEEPLHTGTVVNRKRVYLAGNDYTHQYIVEITDGRSIYTEEQLRGR